MEQGLRPDRLEANPNSPNAIKIFKHWLFIFKRYKCSVAAKQKCSSDSSSATTASEDEYLGLLANYLSPENFLIISDCPTYESAISALESAFLKPANEILSRHLLATRKQFSGESIDAFLHALRVLSAECNFKDVSATTYRNESIRDAFISGLESQHIRSQLLENSFLDLNAAVNQARALNISIKSSPSKDFMSRNEEHEFINTSELKEEVYDICEEEIFTEGVKEEIFMQEDEDLWKEVEMEEGFGCGAKVGNERSAKDGNRLQKRQLKDPLDLPANKKRFQSASEEIAGMDFPCHPRSVGKAGEPTLRSRGDQGNEEVESFESKFDLRHSPEEEDVSRAAGDSSEPKNPPRPRRPCLFCGKFDSKLTRHLTHKHRDMEMVKKALELPQLERIKEFDKIRKRGMFEHNLKLLKQNKNAPLLMERTQPIQNGAKMCCYCNGIFGKKYFSAHKARCHKNSSSIDLRKANSTLLNSYTSDKNIEEIVGIKDFEHDVNYRFRKRESKETVFCLTNEIVQSVGKNIYGDKSRQPVKDVQIRKTTMAAMRILSRLLLTFVEEAAEMGYDLYPEHVFDVSYFHIFEASINLLGQDQDKIKHGTKQQLHGIIHSLINTMTLQYMVQKNTELQAKINDFKVTFQSRRTVLFGEARFPGQSENVENIVRPTCLFLDSDVGKLIDYLKNKLKDLNEQWILKDFIEARRLVLCYLTFLNARWSAEPSKLTIKDVNTAIKNSWMNQEKSPKITDPSKTLLLHYNKIAFRSGRGSKQLQLSVIIPDFLIPVIMKLCDCNERQKANINDRNLYVFPSSGLSLDPASGWHDISNVFSEANLDPALNTDQSRSRASILFAALNLPCSERKKFYELAGLEKNEHL